MAEVDDEFWDRADAHIHLSNSQITESIGSGKVSASHMYSSARFAAWLSFTGFENAEQMKSMREENIRYFVAEFEKVLIENYSDYEENFEKYRSS